MEHTGVDHEHWRLRIARTNNSRGDGGNEVWMTPYITTNRSSTSVKTEIKFRYYKEGRGYNSNLNLFKDDVDTKTICDGIGDLVNWEPRMYALWARYFGPARDLDYYKKNVFDPLNKEALLHDDHPHRVEFPFAYGGRVGDDPASDQDPQTARRTMNDITELENVFSPFGTLLVFFFGDRQMTETELGIVAQNLQQARGLPEAPSVNLLRAMLVRKLTEDEFGLSVLNYPPYIQWEENVKETVSLAKRLEDHEKAEKDMERWEQEMMAVLR